MTRKYFRRPGIVPVTSFLLAFAAVQSAACNSEPAEDSTYTREKLMDPLTCKKCHEDHYNEWAGSMHAYASIDPVFRAMNARGQRETEKTLDRFCVNCHAPLAVQEKATTDGTNLADVPDKFQGVTCYFCHQVTGTHDEHNNPLDLANDTTMRGGYDNPTKNEAHRSAYSPLHDSNDLESSKLCGTCHDISVPAHFSGATKDVALERTHLEWQSSIFATGKGPQSCGACHFDKKGPVPIADYPGVGNRPVRHVHDFPGVDVALTDFPNKTDQMKAVLGKLATSLRVLVCISPPGTAGSAMTIKLENVAIGHNMPSGASQDRRLWIEVHVYDNAPGQPEHETFTRGVVPAGTPVVDLLQTEPDLMLFRDEALDKNGNPAHMFWDIASIKPQPAKVTEGSGGTIGVPITNDPFLGHQNHDVRLMLYNKVPFGATRAPVTVHMQPMGLDVLDDLVASGDLDAAIRDAMPTLDFLPNAGVTATVDWTIEASSPGGDSDWNCVETSQ